MESIGNFFHELTDPHSIIEYGGLALLLFVVFAETGLLVGFFLPGDSLLFISGMIVASEPELLNVQISTLIIWMILAAVTGNVVGYYFGKRVGPALFTRDDSLIFKKRYIEITDNFYQKNGGKTLILGRFLPVIRTFAPILAGVIKIPFGRFMFFNITGAILWVTTLTLTGYFLGEFQWVHDHLGLIVIFLIVITMIPIIRTYLNANKKSS